MRKSCEILRMRKSDVENVYKLEEIVHPNHHWSKDSFYNELSNNLAAYYVLNINEDTLAGFIGIWRIIDEAHITTLSVHPKYRRKQIAQALLIQIIDDCYENMVKYITLEVRESNTPAILLYEKFLFETIGVRKHYYQDNNENALIMFTQNIWHDRFKENFNLLKQGIHKIDVQYCK